MEKAGIAISAVPLAMPGIEDVFNTALAVKMVRKVNDELYNLYRTGLHAHRFLT